MGLETGVTYIDDLVATNPLGSDNKSQGDDHIRNIKTALQGSFPSLGSAAVTASAADLNKVASANIASNFVTAFNGRQGSVSPAANDYAINQLSDVDTATAAPGDYDILGWNNGNSEWEPKAGPRARHALYYGNGGVVGNRHYFTASYYDQIDGVLADITNDGVSGFLLEATETILLTVSFSADITIASGGSPVAARVEIARNQSGTGTPSGAEVIAKSRITQDNAAACTPHATATLRMESGDTITLTRNSASITTSDARVQLAAVRCA